jgi:hypothetical protein
MFEEDHGRSPQLIVRRYTVGDLAPLSKYSEASLFIRGLPSGATGRITVVSSTKKYRLDAEVLSGGTVRWPLNELYSRVGIDSSTLLVVARRITDSGVTFFPAGVQQSNSTTTVGKVVLTLENPRQSPSIVALLGRTQSAGRNTRACKIAPNSVIAGSWYSVGIGDSLNVANLPQPDGDFCIRFEIQVPSQSSTVPDFDRQEFYFAK